MSRFFVAVAATGLLLAAGIHAAEQKQAENCRDCDASKSRLLETCTTERRRSLTPEESAPYCRWVVRVAPAQGARERAIAQKEAAEEKAIRAAIAPLAPVQPAQIESERAGVLAQRPDRPAGEYAIVSLTRRNGAWHVESVTDVPARR